jgi:hypothetical protein
VVPSLVCLQIDSEAREGVEMDSQTAGTIPAGGTVVILQLKDGLGLEKPRFRCNKGWMNLFRDSGEMVPMHTTN